MPASAHGPRRATESASNRRGSTHPRTSWARTRRHPARPCSSHARLSGLMTPTTSPSREASRRTFTQVRATAGTHRTLSPAAGAAAGAVPRRPRHAGVGRQPRHRKDARRHHRHLGHRRRTRHGLHGSHGLHGRHRRTVPHPLQPPRRGHAPAGPHGQQRHGRHRRAPLHRGLPPRRWRQHPAPVTGGVHPVQVSAASALAQRHAPPLRIAQRKGGGATRTLGRDPQRLGAAGRATEVRHEGNPAGRGRRMRQTACFPIRLRE